jgi:hypothetical protein
MMAKRFGVARAMTGALLLLGAAPATSAGAETLVFHASQSGMQTLDQGEAAAIRSQAR